MAKLTGRKPLESVTRLIAYFDRTEEHGNPSDANALLGAPTATLGEWIRNRREAP